MKPVLRQAAMAATILFAAGAASAGVTVTYKKPDQFADVPHAQWEREAMLKRLTIHFNKLADGLPPGQQLEVEVLDIDLAGTIDATRRQGAMDIRVINRGADWPHMQLRYTVTENGKAIKTGEDKLADQNYAHRPNRYKNDELRYEKQMLDDWFKASVAQR